MPVIEITQSMTEQEFRAVQDSTNRYLDTRYPVGSVLPFAGSTVPSGFLLCDGSAVSRATYVDLFNAIGITYGSGNGSTTFNLPNIKGRVLVGLDATQTEFNAVGKTGGAKTHTLTINEMPGHNHGGSLKNLGHGGIYSDGTTAQKGYAGTTLSDSRTDTITTQGGGAAHNNLQPYIAMHYIISALSSPVGTDLISAHNTSSTSHSDIRTAISAALDTAKSYAEVKASGAEMNANNYTDIKVSTAESNSKSHADNLVDPIKSVTGTIKSNGSGGFTAATKADIGLGNVDDTSDMNKPVSNPQSKFMRDNYAARCKGIAAGASPITITDCAEYSNFNGLTIKGVSTQSGTPTPTAPVPIAGASPTKITVAGVEYALPSLPTLYSLPNGATDTFDAVSGIYTKHIVKTVLDGTGNWLQYPSSIGQANPCFYVSILTNRLASVPVSCTHDVSTSSAILNGSALGLWANTSVPSASAIHWCVPYSLIGTSAGSTASENVAAFKAWLAEQYAAGTPVTIYYQLAAPTITQHAAITIPQISPATTISVSSGTLEANYSRDIATALSLKADKAQEAWLTPTLLNGWVAYDADRTPKYFKDNMGNVEIRGCLKSGTVGQPSFNLPAGYRPNTTLAFTVPMGDGTIGTVTITSTGVVNMLRGNNTQFYISGMKFRADA